MRKTKALTFSPPFQAATTRSRRPSKCIFIFIDQIAGEKNIKCRIKEIIPGDVLQLVHIDIVKFYSECPTLLMVSKKFDQAQSHLWLKLHQGQHGTRQVSEREKKITVYFSAGFKKIKRGDVSDQLIILTEFRQRRFGDVYAGVYLHIAVTFAYWCTF